MKKRNVWFFPEFEDEHLSLKTIRLIKEALRSSKRMFCLVEGCLIGEHVGKQIDLLAQQGVDTVYLVEHELLAQYTLDAYTHVMSELIKKYEPSIVLFVASSNENELAGRIAVKTNSNCVIQADSLKIHDEFFSVTKSGYNDKVTIYYEFSTAQPLILSMRTDYSATSVIDHAVAPQIIRENIEFQSLNMRTKPIGVIKGDPRTLKLEEADRIVSVGRGLRPEHMPQVKKLVDLLGASIGGTRPAVDDGMVPFERQIGITGKTISPNLIVNFALSGAREFTAGIEYSSLNIAINTDKNAPIFKIADVCAIGDAKEIMGHLINLLEQKKDEAS